MRPEPHLRNLGSVTARRSGRQTAHGVLCRPRPVFCGKPHTDRCEACNGFGGYVLEALDAAAVRGWGRAALASVEAHRAELDALNVFPIPDGDTGTNLVLTLRAGVEAMDASSTDAAEALRQLSRGAVLGARGNSGVIMSQLLRSLAEAAAGSALCDAAVLRDGLTRGARDARDAVKDPVEGTILTVAQAAADAVTDESAALAEVTSAALAAAELALLRTTQQLAELSRAGVVDAGGLGLVLVLEALARVVGAAGTGEPGRAAAALPRMGLCDPASSPHAYEVQYLLDAEPEAVAGLGDTLAALGDSVVVVGTGDDPRLDRCADVTHMDVDVPHAVAGADHTDRIAQRGERVPQSCDGLRFGVEQVLNLVGMWAARGVAQPHPREGSRGAPRLASAGCADDAGQRLQHEHQTQTARVDDAGARELGQLLGGAEQGQFGGGERS